MKLSELCLLLHGELVGDGEIDIKSLAKIEDAGEGDLTFLANPRYEKFLDKTNASAILVSKGIETLKIPHIRVDDPYISFQKSLNLIYPEHKSLFTDIHPSAIVSDGVSIANNVGIGPFVYIAPGAEIGENTVIYPGCIIEENVKIGKNCKLSPNVSINYNCEIGNNVIIHSGVVIGSDGFGFAPSGQRYGKIPQVGKVVIENDVEIGANCAIDRATIGETRIKNGCKLDNLIQIAHNVVVGEDTVIAAQSGISGSTKVGKHVTIAGQVGVIGHIEVGDNAILAAKSGISKSVPTGEVLFGIPAIPLAKQKKIEVISRHLPEMSKKIHQMEKTIIKLEEQLKKIGAVND